MVPNSGKMYRKNGSLIHLGAIMSLFPMLAFLALSQPDAEEVSRKLLLHFQSLEDLHIKGEFQTTNSAAGPIEYSSKIVFDFYKHGGKLKYFEKLAEYQTIYEKETIENANEFEYFKNEAGFFNINNDPKTGRFQNGDGLLFDGKSDIIGLKSVYINKPLAPLTGNFAFTVVNMFQNPCYSFEELLQISKAELKKETLNPSYAVGTMKTVFFQGKS